MDNQPSQTPTEREVRQDASRDRKAAVTFLMIAGAIIFRLLISLVNRKRHRAS